MPPISRFILPPRELASCIAACIYRDSCGADLADEDRLNYFPASPFFSASVMLVGELHVSDILLPLHEVKRMPVVPSRIYGPPKSAPHMSWSPGPIEGFTVAFFPDAWLSLGGSLDGTPPDCLHSALAHFDTNSLEDAWPVFWREMTDAWTGAQRADGASWWNGSYRIKTWTYHLIGKAAQTGSGRSLRSVQRRVQRWTGQNTQSLNFFARVEELHRLVTKAPNAPLVALAAEAGFADQSHMGRALKRATGFSPFQLNQRIAEDEAFWCYRLLGERY
jgi:AraC-like DNA-binding protein